MIWAGKGRSKEDFKHFFDDMPKGYLSEVCAVAMDMNASCNILFSEKLPKAVIVYDRYHMQAQYGKEVLGAVRLQEARKHQSEAKNILETAESLDDPEQKRRLKAEAKEEKQRYSQLKGLRWTLLTNGAKLSDEKAQHLQSILSDHSDLAVCYAMKEELCALFELRDPLAAYEGWKRWFDAAEASGIPLMPFFRSAQANWRASTTKSRWLSVSATAIETMSISLPSFAILLCLLLGLNPTTFREEPKMNANFGSKLAFRGGAGNRT